MAAQPLQNTGDRSTQIDQLVRGYLRGGSSDQVGDDALILARHPELMPELGERLHAARRVVAAAAAARSADDSRGDADDEAELAFLRTALPAYEILRLEHRGGQGVVYRAVQRSTGRQVALKMPHDGLRLSNLARERFEREVRVSSQFDHPHIVRLFDAGLVAGRRYYAMEFVEGARIDNFVLSEGLEVRQIVRLFAQVARAVHHAHTRGIIHRDLKPQNILVTLDGEPRVLDFGLAKVVDTTSEDEALSMPGNIIGTLPYTSPEQASGDGDVQTTSDVYALGVVLYELLTESRPYPLTNSPGEMRRHICTTPPKSARKVLAERPVPTDPGRRIPRELDAILMKALRKEPSARYQSAAALAEDLERCLAGELVHALADNAHYVVRTLIRRHRRAAFAIAGVAVVLVGALVGVSLAWQSAERARRIAQAGLEMAGRGALGSAERDGNRIADARTLFESAVAIGEEISSDNPVVQHFLHAALRGLADVYRRGGYPEDADLVVTSLAGRAERDYQVNPSDPQRVRRLALARGAEADNFQAKGDFEAALGPAKESLELLRGLAEHAPDVLTALRPIANALTRLGGISQNLFQAAEALAYFTDARDVYAALVAVVGPTTIRRIELLRAEANIASWHVFRTDEAHDRIARELHSAAFRTLEELEAQPDAGLHQLELQELGRNLRYNQKILDKRALRLIN